MFWDNVGISQIKFIWLLIRRWIRVLIKFTWSGKKLFQLPSAVCTYLPSCRSITLLDGFPVLSATLFHWLSTAVLFQWFISRREAREFLLVLADSPVAAQQHMLGKTRVAHAAQTCVTVASSAFLGRNPQTLLVTVLPEGTDSCAAVFYPLCHAMERSLLIPGVSLAPRWGSICAFSKDMSHTWCSCGPPFQLGPRGGDLHSRAFGYSFTIGKRSWGCSWAKAGGRSPAASQVSSVSGGLSPSFEACQGPSWWGGEWQTGVTRSGAKVCPLQCVNVYILVFKHHSGKQ